MQSLRSILVPVLIAGLLAASAGRASPTAAQDMSCTAFNSRVWAQTVFDEDLGRSGALDPDDDGLACEELPPGIAPALWADAAPDGAIPVDFESVTDGDSIVVAIDGRREEVRLVGIDTHESGGPYQDVECYGPEAANFLAALLAIGGDVSLEQDQEDRDQYGRLLRWVWVDFGTGQIYLLNEALVRAGYAERFRNTPNRRYVDNLMDAEAFAQRYDLGLWGACDGDDAFGEDGPATLPAGSDTGSLCDSAYPDVCVPSPPPDLQCSDVPYKRFRVLPPDPHNFDGNFDGVACEGPG